MRITKHFILNEFVVSKDHPELVTDKITELDLYKLWFICSTILEPLRLREIGPIKILSGKRSKALNKAVGGSITSDHLFEHLSCAVDFTVIKKPIGWCFDWIKANLPYSFGQLIFYPDKNFIHVSLPTPKHLGESFIQ